ncbi:MAG: sigma-70 family RNA polymerase sigma factor [Planctomycetota bacterium]
MQPAVTQLLQEMRGGNTRPINRLFPLVYDELRLLAHRQLQRYRPQQTLNTTGLLHEAYLKLVDQTQALIEDRSHFYAVSALAMRQIIVDYARSRRAHKRGGPDRRRELLDAVDGAPALADEQATTILDLDAALVALTKRDERLAEIVNLRFFGGLSVEEVAEVLGVSVPTVKRDTRVARAFLKREMDLASDDDSTDRRTS